MSIVLFTLSSVIYPTMSLVFLLTAALVLGAAGTWAQRWLLDSRAHVLNWLLVVGLGAAGATAILLPAFNDMPAVSLLGESLNSSSAWLMLAVQVFAASASMWSLWLVAVGVIDRLIHRSSRDALASARHMCKVALPTSVLMMGAGFVLPAILGINGSVSVVSSVIGCLLWLALQIVMVLNMAGMSGAMALRSSVNAGDARNPDAPTAADGQETRDDRLGLWLFIGCIVTMVLAVVGFILLSVTMVTFDTAGRGMMVLLGLGVLEEPSAATMAVRWFWVDGLMVLVTAAGAAGMMRFGRNIGCKLGPSFGSMTRQEGSLSWFKRSVMNSESFNAGQWGDAFESGVSDVLSPLAIASSQVEHAASTEQVDALQDNEPQTNQSQSSKSQASQPPAGVPAMLNVPPTPIGSTQAGQRKSSKLPPIAPKQPTSAVAPNASMTAAPRPSGSSSKIPPTSTSSVVVGAVSSGATGERAMPGQPASWASLARVFPTRGHYVALALLAAVFVFYASLIPVEYKPLSWNNAVQRFSKIKYYELGIDRRADVLANLVVIVPVTYLLMAAMTGLTWGWLRRGMAAVVTAALATAFVVAIEFTQEWFPPRTISLNDIQAGLSGAAVGIILWLAIGDFLTYMVKVAVSKRGSATALRQVLWLILGAIVVYGMFPMDFTLSPATLAKKYEQGRLVLVPFLQGNDGELKTIAIFMRDLVLFIPIGLLAWRPWTMRQPLRWNQSMWAIAALAVVLELMRLPVFSSHSGTVHILGKIAGGAAGLWLAARVLDEQGQLSLGEQWQEGRRRMLGTAAGVGMTVLAALALLYPFKFEADPALFKLKMDHFINWPFQLYYYAGEWSALSKVVQCMALFMATGLLMRWAWNASSKRRWQGLVATVLLVGVIGMGVELAQASSGQRIVHKMSLDEGISMGMQEQAMDVTDLTVSKGMLFSIGQVADITDLLAYLSGAMAGWMLAGLVLPVKPENE